MILKTQIFNPLLLLTFLKNIMKKIIFFFGVLCFNSFAFGQVGIGTSSPDSSSILQLNSTNKGFLPPKLALTGAGDSTTIPNPANGLVVYNTNTTALSQGLFVNTGSPVAPNWRMLQLQASGGVTIEYSGLNVLSAPVDLNSYPSTDNQWREITDLRQTLTVSVGTTIKTFINAGITALNNGTYGQCDLLIKITPGNTPSPSLMPYSANTRSTYTVVRASGYENTTGVAAKTLTATGTDYVIQVYASRANTPTNLTSWYIANMYLNTLATK